MTLTLQTVSTIIQKPSKAPIPPEGDISGLKTEFACKDSDTNDAININASDASSSPLANLNHPNSQYSQVYPSIQYGTYGSFITPQINAILTPQFLKSTREKYILPIIDIKQGHVVLPVECGTNQAFMILNRLCQGSKGPCILFKNSCWLTPNEFQLISGRETAKDWKRSIRHNGKSIKLLINKGILIVHSPLCECGSITASSMKMGTFLGICTNTGVESRQDCFPYAFSSTEQGKDASHLKTLEPKALHLDYVRQSIGATWDSLILGSSSTRNLQTSPGSDDDNNTDSGISELSSGTRLVSSRETKNKSVEMNPPSPVSRSSMASSLSPLSAESQSDETSVTGSATSMNNNNNNNDSPSPPKSKRKSKPSVMKSERQSPQLNSSTSPPMTPPPVNSTAGGHSPPPSQPIKQMEQMMSPCNNYSEFMRRLAAKYNNQSNTNTDYYRPAANFGFDTRFLKPAAAAALLNLGCSQLPPTLFGGEKDKFPLMDMSSTQALLSMVRSATAAAANNLETLKSNQISHKRPSSPLDLSARDLSTTPPPQKKPKSKTSIFDHTQNSKASTPICLSSCSSGCTEDAQTMVNWSVDEVCRFISTIDVCKEYVEAFRDHLIDGSTLMYISTDLCCSVLNMKLGPALKLKTTIAKNFGNCVVCSHCTHCHNQNNNSASNSP